jgi:hypothetical protein
MLLSFLLMGCREQVPDQASLETLFQRLKVLCAEEPSVVSVPFWDGKELGQCHLVCRGNMVYAAGLKFEEIGPRQIGLFPEQEQNWFQELLLRASEKNVSVVFHVHEDSIQVFREAAVEANRQGVKCFTRFFYQNDTDVVILNDQDTDITDRVRRTTQELLAEEANLSSKRAVVREEDECIDKWIILTAFQSKASGPPREFFSGPAFPIYAVDDNLYVALDNASPDLLKNLKISGDYLIWRLRDEVLPTFLHHVRHAMPEAYLQVTVFPNSAPKAMNILRLIMHTEMDLVVMM